MLIEGGVVIGGDFDGCILRTANTLPSADSKLKGMEV